MRILLVTNYAPDRQQSMLRYADLLARELGARGILVRKISPPAVFGKLAKPGAGLGKWLGYIDKFLLFPPRLRWQARRTDVVHICDHSNAMYLPRSPRLPWVVTCHDLLAIRSALGEFAGISTSRTGKVLQAWICSGLRRARFAICVSHKTCADWQKLIGGHAVLQLIHNPMNWAFEPSTAEAVRAVRKARNIDPGEYLLSVGADHWYKNRIAAVDIFAELRRLPRFAALQLVFAGKPPVAEVRARIEHHELSSHVVVIAEPDNATLQALYTGATALLFPSREEGFGWPILEAQACGCPVITTDREPMREVSGGAAILIDPGEPSEAAAQIARQLQDIPGLRESGFRNAARFDLHRTVDEYIAFYEAARKGSDNSLSSPTASPGAA